MDLFLAVCQALGLALAAGIFAGASGRRDAIGTALLVARRGRRRGPASASSLTEEDHPAWPGFLAGSAARRVAFTVTRDVASPGPPRREDAAATDGR